MLSYPPAQICEGQILTPAMMACIAQTLIHGLGGESAADKPCTVQVYIPMPYSMYSRYMLLIITYSIWNAERYMYTNAERLFHRVLTQGRVPGPPAVNLEKISYF